MLKILCATVLNVGIAAALVATPMPCQSAAAQTTAKVPAKETTRKKRTLSPGQIAAHERQVKCGAEWKAPKKDGKIGKGMKVAAIL